MATLIAANYQSKTVIDDKNPLDVKAAISGGKQKELSVRPAKESKIFSKRGADIGYSTKTYFKNNLKAPIKYGEKVGEVVVFKDGVEIDRVELIANETIEKASLFDQFKNIANDWFIK